MKTAVYIEDGLLQTVLTPENEFEENIIKAFGDKDVLVTLFRGGFSNCPGGWVKMLEHESDKEAPSIMLRAETLKYEK